MPRGATEAEYGTRRLHDSIALRQNLEQCSCHPHRHAYTFKMADTLHTQRPDLGFFASISTNFFGMPKFAIRSSATGRATLPCQGKTQTVNWLVCIDQNKLLLSVSPHSEHFLAIYMHWISAADVHNQHAFPPTVYPNSSVAVFMGVPRINKSQPIQSHNAKPSIRAIFIQPPLRTDAKQAN